MILKFKKLLPWAMMPSYGTPGSACFDLWGKIESSSPVKILDAQGNEIILNRVLFQTGIAVEVPEGHAMMIYSRSGDGFNRGARLANCVAVIDSDYRGEIKVMQQFDQHHYELKFSNEPLRIAQAMIIPYPKIEFEEVQELSETMRGTSGFGSTGSN